MHPVRGRGLLDLIEQCPDACRWREAASLDVDVMREQVEASDSTKRGSEWRPRASEFTLTNYLLLQLVNNSSVQTMGKQLKNVPMLRGPRSAEDHVREEQAAKAALSIIAQVTPHALKGGRRDG